MQKFSLHALFQYGMLPSMITAAYNLSSVPACDWQSCREFLDTIWKNGNQRDIHEPEEFYRIRCWDTPYYLFMQNWLGDGGGDGDNSRRLQFGFIRDDRLVSFKIRIILHLSSKNRDGAMWTSMHGLEAFHTLSLFSEYDSQIMDCRMPQGRWRRFAEFRSFLEELDMVLVRTLVLDDGSAFLKEWSKFFNWNFSQSSIRYLRTRTGQEYDD